MYRQRQGESRISRVAEITFWIWWSIISSRLPEGSLYEIAYFSVFHFSTSCHAGKVLPNEFSGVQTSCCARAEFKDSIRTTICDLKPIRKSSGILRSHEGKHKLRGWLGNDLLKTLQPLSEGQTDMNRWLYFCLHHIVVIYDMIWHDVIWYDMIWYDIMWYDMIWYGVISGVTGNVVNA